MRSICLLPHNGSLFVSLLAFLNDGEDVLIKKQISVYDKYAMIMTNRPDFYASSYAQGNGIPFLQPFSIPNTEAATLFDDQLKYYIDRLKPSSILSEDSIFYPKLSHAFTMIESITLSSEGKAKAAFSDLYQRYYECLKHLINAHNTLKEHGLTADMDCGHSPSNYQPFCIKMDLHCHLNGFIMTNRAIWDKIMNVIVIRYGSSKEIKDIEGSGSKKKSKKELFLKLQPQLKYPPLFSSVVKHILKNFDCTFRTPEAHGSGLLRKFTFSDHDFVDPLIVLNLYWMFTVLAFRALESIAIHGSFDAHFDNDFVQLSLKSAHNLIFIDESNTHKQLIKDLLKAIEKDAAESQEYIHAHTQYLMQLDNHQEALQALDDGIKKHPDSVELLFNRAKIYHVQNNTPLFRKAMTQIVSKDFRYSIGKLHPQHFHTTMRAEYLNKMEFSRHYLTRRHYHYDRGLDFSNLKNYNSAVKEYQECLQLSPECTQAKLGLARSYSELQLFEKSYPLFDQLCQELPLNAEVWYARGMSILSDLKSRGIGSTSTICPTYEHDQNQLMTPESIALRDQGTAHFLKCLSLNPAFLNAIDGLASMSMIFGDFDTAIQIFSDGIDLNPIPKSFTHFHLNRGICLKQNRQYQDAIYDFKKVLENNPIDGAAKIHMADCMSILGHSVEAVTTYAEAVLDEPTNPEFVKRLCEALCNRHDETFASSTIASDIDSLRSSTMRLRDAADWLYKSQHHSIAIQMIEKAIFLEPDNYLILGEKAYIEYETLKNQAEKIINQLLNSSSPNTQSIHSVILSLLTYTNDAKLAIRNISSEMHPDLLNTLKDNVGTMFMRLADCYMLLKNQQMVIQNFKLAAEYGNTYAMEHLKSLASV